MTLGIRASIAGLQTLTQGLGELGRTMQNRILRKGMNAATQPLLAGAKSRCKSKLIKRSLGRKVKTYRGSGAVVGIVGPRTGFATVVDGVKFDPAKVAHLLEGGRKAVSVKKAQVLAGHGRFWGRQVAAAQPEPFLRPAYDAGKDTAASRMAEKVREELATEAAKIAAKVR